MSKIISPLQSRYNETHFLWSKVNRPGVVKDGHYLEPAFPDVTKTNGLTDFCQNMVNWSGGRVKRINVTARISEKIVASQSGNGYFKEKRYTKSASKGTADLVGSLRGTALNIEIKNKYTHDTMKPHQWKEKQKAEAAGEQYWIVTCAEDFLQQLDGFLWG